MSAEPFSFNHRFFIEADKKDLIQFYGKSVDLDAQGNTVVIAGTNLITIYKRYGKKETIWAQGAFNVIAATKQPYNVSLTECNVLYYADPEGKEICAYDLLKVDRKTLVSHSDKLFAFKFSATRNNKYLLIASLTDVYVYDINLQHLHSIHKIACGSEVITVYANTSIGFFAIKSNSDYKAYSYHFESNFLQKLPDPLLSCSTTGFGTSLSYCEVTDTLAIGGPLNNFNKGAVWIYTDLKSGNPIQILIETENPEFYKFGTSVALSYDILMIGSALESKGAYLMYNLVSDKWMHVSTLVNPNNCNGFGSTCKMSKDTSTLILGAPDYMDGQSFIFERKSCKETYDNIICNKSLVLKQLDQTLEMCLDKFGTLSLNKNAECIHKIYKDSVVSGEYKDHDYGYIYFKIHDYVMCFISADAFPVTIKLPLSADSVEVIGNFYAYKHKSAV